MLLDFPTSFQHAIQEEVLRQRKPKDHDTLVPRLPVYMAGQPNPATYPPGNSRPYDQRLWKPIGFPKKKAGDMIHPAISGGENSSSPGSHIPKKLKANFSGPVAKITSCPGFSHVGGSKPCARLGKGAYFWTPGISQFRCVFLVSSKQPLVLQIPS